MERLGFSAAVKSGVGTGLPSELLIYPMRGDAPADGWNTGSVMQLPHAHAIALMGLIEFFNTREHHAVLHEYTWEVEHPYWCRVQGLGNCPFWKYWNASGPEGEPSKVQTLSETLDVDELDAGIRFDCSEEAEPFTMTRATDAPG